MVILLFTQSAKPYQILKISNTSIICCIHFWLFHDKFISIENLWGKFNADYSFHWQAVMHLLFERERNCPMFTWKLISPRKIINFMIWIVWKRRYYHLAGWIILKKHSNRNKRRYKDIVRVMVICPARNEKLWSFLKSFWKSKKKYHWHRKLKILMDLTSIKNGIIQTFIEISKGNEFYVHVNLYW